MSSEVEFQPLARRTYVAEAIRTIKDMILDGRLAPGQRLPPERSLSEALGVSRPTVREAIRSLQAMNILESRHGAGTFVASLSVDELLRPLQFVLSLAEGGLDHLFEVRLLLEPGAAALAAERASDEQVAGLRDCAARAEAEAIDDAEAMLRLDIELHERIFEACGQPAAPAPVGGDERARRREPLLHGAAARRAPADDRGAPRDRRGDRRARPRRSRAAMAAHITRIRDAALAPRAPD